MEHLYKIDKEKPLKNIARVNQAGAEYALEQLKTTFYLISRKEKTAAMNKWSKESKLKFVTDTCRHFLNHENYVAESGEVAPKGEKINGSESIL